MIRAAGTQAGKTLAVMTAAGLVLGQAYAQAAAIPVRDAPVHAVPGDDNGPVEANAPPNTLNAQYAAQSRPAPAFLSVRAEPAEVPQSRDEGPSTPIAGRIVDAAGAFETYMRRTTAIDGKFVDGGAVSKAMVVGASYEIQQFQEGATAYAALAALQDPAFVQSVYDMGRDPRDRADLAKRLLAQPNMVMELDGADEAAAMVSGILAHMGTNLVRAGQAVKQSSYDVQRQPWSKEDGPRADDRLAQAKAQSGIKASLTPADTEALIRTIVALRKTAAPQAMRGDPSPVVVHGLAVAALAVLGRAGEGQIDQIMPLLDDAKSADCMKMAKLNLYQCMAAAGPHYEDVFCLGAHAMIDTGQCLVSAAGQSPVPEAQQASAPAEARSVAMPIALISTAGPERQRAYARAEPPPAPAARGYDDEADPRAAPPAYAPAPRRDDLYDDRYQSAPRAAQRDDDRDDDAGAYAPPQASYYGR